MREDEIICRHVHVPRGKDSGNERERERVPAAVAMAVAGRRLRRSGRWRRLRRSEETDAQTVKEAEEERRRRTKKREEDDEEERRRRRRRRRRRSGSFFHVFIFLSPKIRNARHRNAENTAGISANHMD
jgi:hypothetical protein